MRDPKLDKWADLLVHYSLEVERGQRVLIQGDIGALPLTGNTNQSALHWDLVCDLRKDGVVYADKEKIFENGKFLFDDWPSKALCDGLGANE